jgi:hypothetical protein
VRVFGSTLEEKSGSPNRIVELEMQVRVANTQILRVSPDSSHAKRDFLTIFFASQASLVDV